MLHETLIRLHTQRGVMPHFKQNVLSQLITDNLITVLWHSLLKSFLSHSNTLEPPDMQTLCVEMLEKLTHCHSLITSNRLLNQESTWNYESRASWSNYIRKVLNQTGPSGLWMLGLLSKSQHTSRYNVPGKNPFIHLGMTASPQGTCHSLAGPAKLMCPVQTYNPNDQMTEHYSHQFIRTSVFFPWPQEDSQSLFFLPQFHGPPLTAWAPQQLPAQGPPATLTGSLVEVLSTRPQLWQGKDSICSRLYLYHAAQRWHTLKETPYFPWASKLLQRKTCF